LSQKQYNTYFFGICEVRIFLNFFVSASANSKNFAKPF